VGVGKVCRREHDVCPAVVRAREDCLAVVRKYRQDALGILIADRTSPVGEDHMRKGKEMTSPHCRAQSTNPTRTRGRSRTILVTGALLATVLPIALACQGCLFPRPKPPPNVPPSAAQRPPSTPIPQTCLCGAQDHEWGEQGTELQGIAIPTTCQGRAVRVPVTSFSLEGIYSASGTIANARVKEGQLVGVKAGGVAMRPNDWVNVEFSSRVQCTDSDDKWIVRARIKGIVWPAQQASHSEANSSETPVYDVELLDASGGKENWIPACKAGERAVPFSQVWKTDGSRTTETQNFTFACLNAAIGKCYKQWKYVPWNTTTTPPGDVLHQACTRMARADYCGDGTPHTRDNHPVDVWDSAGMLTRSTTMPGGVSGTAAFEAAWNERGALCFNHFRISGSETNCQSTNVPTGASSVAFGMAKCTSDETARTLAGSAPLLFNASVPPTP
jgi:hypothetical protein